MAIKRIRKNIPLFISVGLLFFSVSLAAGAQSVVTAPEYITDSQMKSFVYPTVIGALATALAGFAGVLAFILNRDKSSSREEREVQKEQFLMVTKSIEALAGTVKELAATMKFHDENPSAHMIASAHNHEPIQEDIKDIKEKLTVLLAEHKIMHSNEDRMCALLARRDPKVSPHPRRATDPITFDGGALRGNKTEYVEEG